MLPAGSYGAHPANLVTGLLRCEQLELICYYC
jgi:hypothetical protein